jgi:hypothetical protein
MAGLSNYLRRSDLTIAIRKQQVNPEHPWSTTPDVCSEFLANMTGAFGRMRGNRTESVTHVKRIFGPCQY